jgi:hypothetical protein
MIRGDGARNFRMFGRKCLWENWPGGQEVKEVKDVEDVEEMRGDLRRVDGPRNDARRRGKIGA